MYTFCLQIYLPVLVKMKNIVCNNPNNNNIKLTLKDINQKLKQAIKFKVN